MVKLKAQFKRKSSANNVEIFVPVPDDADTPKFRVSFDFQAQRDVDVLMVLATGRFGVGAIRTRQVRVRVEAQAARRWARIPHACTLWSSKRPRGYVLLTLPAHHLKAILMRPRNDSDRPRQLKPPRTHHD